MAYTLDIDPVARAQIRELPPAGTAAVRIGLPTSHVLADANIS
jgi:hypothetical protein